MALVTSLGLVASIFVSQEHTRGHLERLRQLSDTSAPLSELESRQVRLVRALEGSSSCTSEHACLEARRDVALQRLQGWLDQELFDAAEHAACDLDAQRSLLSHVIARSHRLRVARRTELRCSIGDQRLQSMLTLGAGGSFAFTIAFTIGFFGGFSGRSRRTSPGS
ncbi:MAG TPA: hypothetical protein VML75_19805 [Kofleriaceae bacterium]|nr:hypothetical protein [Kofleriaceae bacterium]